MKIRKARKEDFEEYYRLKVEESKEYVIIIGKHINIPLKKDLKKEFFEFIGKKNKRGYLSFEAKKLAGYMLVSVYNNIWSKYGYIEDIFVKKEFRKKGIATQLVLEFLNYVKSNKINKVYLSVNLKNNNAINLYKKIGFEITKYNMEMKIK
jgi:ribosomal protein S18 acetylase RimI-like enzyme